MVSLSHVYLSARPDARDDDALAAGLRTAVDAARHALPELAVDEVALITALAGLPAAIDAIGDDAIVEVALVLGCVGGGHAALTRLEADFFGPARHALAAMKLGGDLEAEALQEVREKLLVGVDGQPPRILGYAGRGSLRGLIKVVATRAAISLLRKGGRETPGDEAIVDASGESDPELAFLKARYRPVFREAFADAVAGLGARERNLLRLHFLRAVTLEQLATMYGVHRATIVRQLAAVRADLERSTRKGLAERLAVDRSELDSVMDLVRSQLDASVERLLRTVD